MRGIRQRWHMRKHVLWGVLCFVFCAPSLAQAQKVDFVPDSIKMKTAKKDGWFPSLKAGFNFSFAQSDGVVGIPDGTTLNLGLQLDAGLLFAKGQHEWRSSAKVVHTQTKIPTIKPFIKSADRFDLETMYTYRFKRPKWLGYFVGAKLNTALLAGFLVRDADTALVFKDPKGTVLDLKDGEGNPFGVKKDQPFLLTHGFSPLLLKASTGLSALPIERKPVRLDIKLGVGVVQAITQSSTTGQPTGFIVTDDATTPALELTQLQDYLQAGGELQVAVSGSFKKGLLTYSLLAEIMVPFVSTADTNLTLVQQINTEIALKLGIKLTKWAALNYNLSVVRAPLLVDDWQITNNLMLSITASIL